MAGIQGKKKKKKIGEKAADVLPAPAHHEGNNRLSKVSESSSMIPIHVLVDGLDA